MKKYILRLLVLVVLVIGGGVYYVQSKYLGIGLPWTSTVALPEFPKLPEPMTNLAEKQEGLVYFSTKSPYDFSRLLNGYDVLPSHSGVGQLYLPKGASADNRVPAIIIIPGSGGINARREPVYAKLFNQMGIAALILNYYEPRGGNGEDNYIRKMLTTTEADIMVDALSAQKLLATHPDIDPAKIGVTGYSYGGMVTRYLLDPRIKRIVAPDVPPFALHMDFYGPCHQTLGEDKTTGGAYLAIFGDKDNSVDPAVCNKVQGVLKANGTSVESHVLAGAGHAWEIDTALKLHKDNPYVRGCSFSFDPKTGKPLVDGKPVSAPADNATRDERAYTRAAIGLETKQCVHYGYLMGSNLKADKQAKAIMTAFLKKQGFVKIEGVK